MGKPVPLELTADEAPVLFEFLSRYSDNDVLSTVDQSEQRAHCMVGTVAKSAKGSQNSYG
jgi:hypothetical protein